jgi:[ribosomal protein S18]-alanine N-acetyltransferase
MTVALRRAVPGDARAMAAIDRQASPSPWSEAQFTTPCAPDAAGEYALVAEADGTVLGFVVCQQVLDEATIHNVAVAPAARRWGIARALLEQLLAGLAPGTRRCLLEVRASNAAALALYRGLGFREDGRRRGYYPLAGGREDAVLMSLEIEREHS